MTAASRRLLQQAAGLLFGGLAALSTTLAFAQPLQSPPTIAIIIDDMGNAGAWDEQLIHLNYPLTLSFLPFRPYTHDQAVEGHELGKEIMLHMPMANTRHLPMGAAGLTPDMGQLALTHTLLHALQSIPYVEGVNNHMGSLLTQEVRPMNWVMQELARYPLYFVDSRTIANSVAAEVAGEHQVPHLTRDVFLDDVLTQQAIDVQFKRLLEIARKDGTAIAIGHPHPATVEYLEQHLPELDAQGIAMATVSGLWHIRHDNKVMFAGRKESILPNMALGQIDMSPAVLHQTQTSSRPHPGLN